MPCCDHQRFRLYRKAMITNLIDLENFLGKKILVFYSKIKIFTARKKIVFLKFSRIDSKKMV